MKQLLDTGPKGYNTYMCIEHIENTLIWLHVGTTISCFVVLISFESGANPTKPTSASSSTAQHFVQ